MKILVQPLSNALLSALVASQRPFASAASKVISSLRILFVALFAPLAISRIIALQAARSVHTTA
jgi:hypothetical protein